ncbi:cytochrome P450 [Trifolium medium]|uniref:Cytochrome P450 n=1 Tax=Trifolium medium TaxID=97028 RepID=A0A392RIS0_9FABA|nr:cytochrome P450 [Trifolium medium]
MAAILWSIWKQRNNKVWNNTLDSQNVVIVRAEKMIKEWNVVRHAQTHNLATTHANVINSWKKPLPGRMKCNIDASFSGNKVGIGMCIRDDSGAFI